ncbi:lipocalin-like domain-containing protein [Sphingomonas hengshuiensis]|uniref:lipocalin-like domain-containing protein n=1 Tax=Sphingomonas hengshuiensis TaxID=1609977 RepID=UPI001D104DD7|nr:lipocalin-like domain-containing protein [Sphingomonas hengshuiensis]
MPAAAADEPDGSTRQQLGTPVYVDTTKDLASHTNTFLESWYINAAFESGGKILGFEWHQGITPMGSSTEFLVMNATVDVWRPYAAAEAMSAKVGASTTEMHVYSSIGALSGDRSEMRFKAVNGNNSVDVVMRPQAAELYNGTTGLLPFLGTDSYEFAFPNMLTKGTITIDGVVHAVNSDAVWFDRQWGIAAGLTPADLQRNAAVVNQAHWTWLGLSFGEGNRSAISFWDVMGQDNRWTFLTYLADNGLQTNVDARIEYQKVWTSNATGQKYPGLVYITAPKLDLELVLTAMMSRPEFVYPVGQGHNGGQSLCRVSGHLGKTRIESHALLEMIGGIVA